MDRLNNLAHEPDSGIHQDLMLFIIKQHYRWKLASNDIEMTQV